MFLLASRTYQKRWKLDLISYNVISYNFSLENKHFPYYNFITSCHNIPASEIFGNQNYIDYDGTQCDKGRNNQQRQA